MNTDATAALDAIPDGIIAFGADWRVLLVNRTAEILLAVSRDEVVGKTLGQDLLYLDETRFSIYRDVMRDRVPRSIPGTRLADPDAGVRHFDGDVYPANSGGIVVVFRDATAPAHADAESRIDPTARAPRHTRTDALGHEVEEDTAAQHQLLATLSHEMRTPLNAILGYAELLELNLAGPLTDEQRGHLERMRISARHLLDLVNAALDLARIQAGQLMVEREQSHGADAIRVALALVQPQIAARGLVVVDQSVGRAPVPYVGDVMRVRQILVNLLANAVKFGHPGGRIEVSCWIAEHRDPEIRATGPGPWACIRVEDSGIGIPPEETERIFEPFVQLHAGGTHAHSGAGLGLAICRRLARAMGGDVSVRSRPGEGSAFTLWLPSPRADIPAEPG